MLIDELHYYINGIPIVAIEDIQHRISDWISSGGSYNDPYIAQQIRYARNCYIKENNIKQISEEKAESILLNHLLKGNFLVDNKDSTFTAIDNTTGEAWTEEFKTIFEAIKYLDRESEVE